MFSEQFYWRLTTNFNMRGQHPFLIPSMGVESKHTLRVLLPLLSFLDSLISCLGWSWVTSQSRNRFWPSIPLYKTYFDIIIGSQEIRKKLTGRSCAVLTSKVNTSFRALGWYQDQEVDIGTIHRIYSDFTNMHTLNWMCVCNSVWHDHLCTFTQLPSQSRCIITPWF
jgi:hypothetical protein